MKLSKTAFRILLFTLGVAVGVFACNYTYFVFEKEINYFDLFSLIITTGLGLYLAVVIGKVSNKQNSEKTLLITEIKDSIGQLDKITKLVDQRNYLLSKMVAEIKTLNEDLHLFETIITKSHCRHVKTAELRQSLSRFRAYGTSISPDNTGFVHLNVSQYASLGNLLRNLKQKYFEAIFAINTI